MSEKRDSNSRPQPWQGCALPLSYSRQTFRRWMINIRPSAPLEQIIFYKEISDRAFKNRAINLPL